MLSLRGAVRRRRIGSVVAKLVVLGAAALVLGFLAFLWLLPNVEIVLHRNADGIVVLTGGTSRVTDGLELLAAGVDETDMLGPSLTPIELWEGIAPSDIGERIIFYEELFPALRSRGFVNLCNVIEEKLAVYQGHGRRRMAVA